AFVCYGPLARLAGGVPVYLETKPEDGFRLTAEGLLSAVTDKTKMLVLPFPNNPTGAVMSEEDLVRIAKVVAEKDLLVLSDEIYAELTYGKKHVSFASLPGMRDRTVVVSGLSKSYAMTGWRIGYTAAPKEITKQMTKVHQFGIMCASTTSQYAGIEALRNGDEDIRAMHDEYNRRRRFIVSGLEAIGFRCFNPEGAFYVFPKIPDLGMNSEEFCRCLFEEENVAIVPGTAFGKCGEGYARISYAYSVEHINRALDKMEQFLAHHA
ncbi:MAG: aminotransferase class I/II-fold pyridoxal phosphate-dependent enzyme, partial [Clostridia bacterium]|nr:aminotransferase class I/II-fold pyridoxal phosphate-dependent enzyme [Clostridia bacterium]